jgi:hypothetical protein
MKVSLLILFLIRSLFTLAQESTNKQIKGGVIEFKRRDNIKTQIKKELQQKEMDMFLKEIATRVFDGNDVDISPNFKEGATAYYQFIQENLNSEVPVLNEAEPGKYQIIVSFVVNQDGTVKDVKAKTNLGYGMEKEAERVIKKSSKLWVPAKIRGVDVICQEEVALTFIVGE